MAVAQGWAAPRHVLILRLLVVTTLIMLSGGLRLSAQEESPRLVLDPASALPGASVTASGWSFPADVPGKVPWSAGTPLADIVTDQAGAFSVTVAVPVVPPGSYIVAAEAQTDTGVARAEATLTVEPATTAEQGNAEQASAPEPPAEPAQAQASAPSVYPIVGSSHSDNSPDAGTVYDGNQATYWMTGPSAPEQAWFTLDIGAVKPIGPVRWIAVSPGTLPALELQFSEDGATWGSLITLDGWSMPAGSWVEQPAGLWARYVRFVVHNTTAQPVLGGISEVQLIPATDARPVSSIITPEPEPTDPPPTAAPTPTAATAPTATATTPPEPIRVTGQGTITDTGDEGAYCYAAPDATSEVITIFPDGTVVDLAGEPANGWQPVVCEGRLGYVGAQYVSVGAPVTPTEVPVTPAATPTTEPTPGPTSTPATTPTTEPTTQATANPGGPLTFVPIADARVERNNPDRNFGSDPTLIADTEPNRQSYLRFEVTGTGPAPPHLRRAVG